MGGYVSRGTLMGVLTALIGFRFPTRFYLAAFPLDIVAENVRIAK
jgi:hypothetical protein